MIRGVCLLMIAACGASPRPVAARLAALSVADDDFYRPVLYTWTTDASIDALRASGRLLTATAKTGDFTSPYHRELAALAAVDDPIATLLETRFPAARYAWPAPFATVMGIGPRTYGDRLIRIDLAPEAWIGRFDPTHTPRFAFVDARGAAVATDDVLAHPERIGAIFHVREDRGVAIRYREYIVCNPAMVAAWSIDPADVVDDEIDLLTRLRTPLAASPRAGPLARLWHRALAFYNRRYAPAPAALDAIIGTLRHASAYSPRSASHSP